MSKAFEKDVLGVVAWTVFVRGAESNDQWVPFAEVPLTGLSRQDAETLAARLQGEARRIYVSGKFFQDVWTAFLDKLRKHVGGLAAITSLEEGWNPSGRMLTAVMRAWPDREGSGRSLDLFFLPACPGMMATVQLGVTSQVFLRAFHAQINGEVLEGAGEGVDLVKDVGFALEEWIGGG